jgi:hypothetical protein
MLYVKRTLDKRPSMFIREKPVLSSERMLHKNYDRKGSVEKIPGRGSQGKLIGGNPREVKLTLTLICKLETRPLVRKGAPHQ